MCIFIYRVSQEERTGLREGVPYVKVYRYKPKHLYQILNVYRDDAQRMWVLLAVPDTANCTSNSLVTMLAALRIECSDHCVCVTLCIISHITSPRGFLIYIACNPKKMYLYFN